MICLLMMFLGILFADIVAAAVLSGNRNFEGRVHPLTRANYLASPPLVVAYALAGTVMLDDLVGDLSLIFLYQYLMLTVDIQILQYNIMDI